MASAELDQTAIVMDATDKRTALRANGSIIAFEGFLKLYQEDHDDPAADSEASDDRLLPSMKEGEPLGRDGVKPEQHFTRLNGSKLWHSALLEYWLQQHIDN